MQRYKKIILCLAILKCAVVFLLFCVAAICHSQTPSSFHIPAQPLASALSDYTRKSGVDLLYGKPFPSGVSSSAVDGSMSGSEALSRLLAGTGLTFRFTGPHTAQLEEAPRTAAGVTQLGPLRVQGAGEGGGSEGGGFFGDVDQNGNRSLNHTAERKVYTTPGSTAYISKEQINRVPPNSIGDIFKNSPGVISAGNDEASGLNINIRGLQGMNRVNVLVDGTQQTNSQYIGYQGNTSSVYIDPDFISGVDISKGPSGGQFGSGAMGGVVNMRTLDATDIVQEGHKYGIQLRGGIANGSKEPQLEVDFPRSGNPSAFNGDSFRWSGTAGAILDRFNIVVGLARRKAGNYFAGSNMPRSWIGISPGPAGTPGTIYSLIDPNSEVFDTSQDEISGMAKVRTQFGNGHSLELGYMNYYDKHGELNAYSLIYAGSFLPLVQGDLSTTRAHTGSIRYGYFPENSHLIHFRANLWGTRLQTHHSPQFFSTFNSTATYNLSYPLASVGTEIWNTSELPTKFGQLNLKYGASFSQENATGQVLLQSYTPYPGDYYQSTVYPISDPSGKRYLGSLFTQANYRIRPWLIFDGSFRIDRYHENGHAYYASFPQKTGNRVNPTVSITAEPWQGIQFFATYALGWRPPALREAYWQFTTLLLPNPDLKPETSNDFEVGTNVSRSNLLGTRDRAQLKFAYFSNRYGNYIGRESLAGNNTLPYSWTNFDKAEYRGVEVQGTYGIPQLFAQGTFTKYTEITYCLKGQPCSSSALSNDYGGGYVPPSYQGSGTLGTSLFHDTLTAGFNINYWSGVAPVQTPPNSDPNHPYVPPATWPKAIIMNAYASYKVMNHFELGASGANLGNRYYVDPLETAYLPAPGRIVRLNATIKF